MGRFIASGRAAGAGSATLPVTSIYSAATPNPRTKELHVWNTTATAVTLALARLTTTGTRGATITPQAFDGTAAAGGVTAYNTHTVAPTLAFFGFQFTLPGVIGAGVILTFGGDVGFSAPSGTTNGIGLYVPTGTGQVVDFSWVWDE